MTAWDDDVTEALRATAAGSSENWPITARTLAAEVTELRGKLEHQDKPRLTPPILGGTIGS